MSDTHLNTLSSPRTMAILAGREERDVTLSFRLRADRSRIFYALSIPEYIETWFQLPPQDELRSVFHQSTQQTFGIDLYRAEELQARVQGSCSTMSSSQIRYTWKIKSGARITDTVADIQLLSALGGCTLTLKHRGFRDALESEWYGKVWRQSLESLSRLMEK
jgi:uncharacterized protein YndB with AHSA1/START domain